MTETVKAKVLYKSLLNSDQVSEPYKQLLDVITLAKDIREQLGYSLVEAVELIEELKASGKEFRIKDYKVQFVEEERELRKLCLTCCNWIENCKCKIPSICITWDIEGWNKRIAEYHKTQQMLKSLTPLTPEEIVKLAEKNE